MQLFSAFICPSLECFHFLVYFVHVSSWPWGWKDSFELKLLSSQERWGYICPDIAKEFAKYEAEPGKWMKKYESVNAVTRKVARNFRKITCIVIHLPGLAQMQSKEIT